MQPCQKQIVSKAVSQAIHTKQKGTNIAGKDVEEIADPLELLLTDTYLD